MTALLESYGFKYLGMCHCSGTKSIKYYLNNYIVYLMPKRYQFRIKKDNSTIIHPTPFTKLETTLNDLNLQKIYPGNVSAQAEAVPGGK